MKKSPRDVIILNLCDKKTRSYDVCLLRYGVFAQTFFCYFRPVFALLPHSWPPKFKFGKNVKKNTWMDILSFYTCVPLSNIIWYLVPEIWSSTDRIFLSSWAFFCSCTLLIPWKWKYQTSKKTLEIIILCKCTKYHDHLLYCSRDMALVGCNCCFHFGLSGIFPSTFLQPVNSC